MTWFLASVCSVDEARIALAGGADFIDLKDPARGALGALDARIGAEIVAHVAGRCSLSATAGDVEGGLSEVVEAVERTAAAGVDFVKLGLFTPRQRSARFISELGAVCGRRHRLIAVLFADRGPALETLCDLAEAGFVGVVLDTAAKGAGSLRRHLSEAQLGAFVSRGRALGLLTGLAGTLGIADIGAMLELAPDLLGFRGALCRDSDRASKLDPDAVSAIRRRIPLAAPFVRGNDAAVEKMEDDYGLERT